MVRKIRGLAAKELLVMLGIIGMLAAVAIPSHIEYERKKMINAKNQLVVDRIYRYSMCVKSQANQCEKLLIDSDLNVERTAGGKIIISTEFELYRTSDMAQVKYIGTESEGSFHWKSESSFCDAVGFRDSQKFCGVYSL